MFILHGFTKNRFNDRLFASSHWKEVINYMELEGLTFNDVYVVYIDEEE